MPTALRAQGSGDLYRDVFDRAHDAMLIAGDDGRYVDGNDAALRLLGIDREQLRRTHATDTPGRHEMRRPDGSIRIVEVEATADVQPGRHLIVMRDITDELRAGEAATRFAAIAEYADDAISGTDLEGRVNFWSSSAERLYGYTGEEVLGRSSAMLLETPTVLTELLARLDRGEHLRHYTAMRVRKDGTRFRGSTTLGPIERDGEVVGFSVVTRDDTERAQLEQQLALVDRLATTGTLAAGIAHEINNPLAALIANFEYVAQQLGGEQALREPLDDARAAAHRIAEIVRELRHLARPGEVSRARIDVREVAKSTVRIASQEVRARARLVEEYREVPRVLANAARIGQIVINLVVNATQAIAEGDSTHNEIFVGTSTDAQGRAVIAVRDTGRGIPREHIGRIFDPFFTTRPYGAGGGSGMGLAICHRLVTELGGEIRVASDGRGSSFEIVLPPAPPEPAAKPVEPVQPASATQRKILVIDDEPIVGRAVRRVLTPAHDVTVVTSAKAALDLIDRGVTFDLILCDLMMPQMTGMELHEHLSAHAPAVAARMVFLTGGAFTPAARAFVERVSNPCFEKPFDAAQLRALAAQHCA
jgi:PAS domain S-box-containing protein